MRLRLYFPQRHSRHRKSPYCTRLCHAPCNHPPAFTLMMTCSQQFNSCNSTHSSILCHRFRLSYLLDLQKVLVYPLFFPLSQMSTLAFLIHVIPYDFYACQRTTPTNNAHTVHPPPTPHPTPLVLMRTLPPPFSSSYQAASLRNPSPTHSPALSFSVYPCHGSCNKKKNLRLILSDIDGRVWGGVRTRSAANTACATISKMPKQSTEWPDGQSPTPALDKF